jgi:ribonuclease G
MSKELVISSNRHETKVAVVEDDQLVEIYFQRTNEYSLAGSIHKGRVTRVLPGMQSAFVDLGLERDTFLYVSDFFEENGEEYDRISDEKPRSERGGERAERGGERAERGERGRDRDRERPPREPEREAPRAESPRVQVSAPPSITLPPAEPAEPAELESQPEPVVERVEESADARDRRGGRRSRRRRSRGRGFPDSKYAADVGSVREERPEREYREERGEPESEGAEAEVFLLPGESLAKYRDRTSGDGEEAAVAVEETADEDDAGIPEERFEAGQVDVVETAPDEDDQGEPLAPLELETVAESEPIVAVAPPEADADVAAAQEPVLTSDDPAAVEDVAEIPEAIPDEFPAGELSAEDIGDAPADDAPDASAEEIDPLSEDADDFDIERVIEETELERLEPAAEAALEQPLTASVREQGGRYPHRASRRMRRKRGGDQRGEAPAAPPVEVRQAAPRTDRPGLPSISDLLREGQEIIVQIAKEPLGQKGARITSHIALPGRYVVFMPTLEHLGVSRKIASDDERLRLKRILQTHRAGTTGGFIVRTAGEGRTEDEIAGDMAYLYNVWLDIRQKAEKKKAPVLLHHDLDIVHRILRDQLSDMFKAIWVDNEEVYESILRFMQRFNAAMVGRVKMFTRPVPIFDAFNVSQEIEKALRPKVWLKSGGYIVVNQTEALVAIDVNTGKYVGKSNRLEDTITKTNTEAVKEIVRQIRLRDLGGIIVIDFIDMDERKNRQKVMQALEEAMRADRAPYKILQFNDFGLVAITRKRVKQSLERSLCSPCPSCEGAGYVKSVQTVVGEILQEAVKIRPLVEGKNVELRVFPEVAKFLKSNSNTYLEEIEEIVRRPVMVISDSRLHPEKFDMAW